MRRIAVALIAAAAALGAAAQESYETPPVLKASDILPADVVKGPNRQFDESVNNDGYTNHFTLTSHYGTFRFEGDHFAYERAREVDAITRIEEVRQTTSYSAGAKAAAESSLNAIKTIVTQPVHTAKAIPSGVKRFFGNVYRMTQGDRGEYEDSYGKEIIGFSSAKRRIAARLAVDPYSSNPRLQEALDDVTWVTYAGGMSVEIFKQVIVPAPVSTGLTVTDTSVAMAEMIKNESPESLLKINRDKLAAIDSTGTMADSLFANPWYSPKRTTLLVDALYELRLVPGVDLYLRTVLWAESEHEAFFHQRNAELLRGYHRNVEPLKAIHVVNTLPVGQTQSDKLALCLTIDHLAWTQETAASLRGVEAALPASFEPSMKELWLTGKASDLSLSNLTAQAWIVRPKAETTLLAGLSMDTLPVQ